MKTFVLKLGIFLLPIWAGSYLLTSILDDYLSHSRNNKQLWSLSQQNQSVDYVVAGSSRAYRHIDIPTLEKRTGGKGINLGYDGESIMDMYLTLHLFLAHNNQARHLVLHLDGGDFESSRKLLNHLYLPYTNDAEVSATLREFSPMKSNLLRMVFPLAKYSEYNEFYSPRFLREARSNYSSFDENAGSELLVDEGFHALPAIEREPEFIVDGRARRYLDRIVELARSRSIRITVFSAPVYHQGPVLRTYRRDSLAYITSYCRDNGISFVDFMDADFDVSEFRDDAHLNGRGALRFTEMLGNSLLDLETKAHATSNQQSAVRKSL